MKKIALLSIDVEDWYHLDYIPENYNRDPNYSMLDGLDNFIDFADKNDISSTLFTLTSVVDKVKETLTLAILNGHEISLHGTNHKKPLEMTLDEFKVDCNAGINKIMETFGISPKGYRASCFSFDRDRLDIINNDLGFKYDSSRINFDSHPLYGSINMAGFKKINDCYYLNGPFSEFEMPTVKLFGKTLPISGGGYLRIIPWWLLSFLIRKYIRKHGLFSMYIHPFEMSSIKPRKLEGIGLITNFRYRYNIKNVRKKLQKLINLLKSEGFEFMTYDEANSYYINHIDLD